MKKQSLLVANPILAGQWHPTRNGDLSPSDVTVSSGKKVWWKCAEGDDHEWDAIVANRSKGSGCPICSNQRVAPSNCLAAVRPDLAKEWHSIKNNDLTPYDVLPSANRKVWWQCSKNSNHEWEAKLNNRYNGKGCPICANQKIERDNSLGTVNPLLAEQWHSTKNEDLTPFDVAPAGNNRVWWKCPKGDDHEWEATVNHRATGTGCPKCNPVWSVPELRVFTELKSLFPTIQHRAMLNGCEIDIYIPEIRVGIEYDGVYWHQDKLDKDTEKNEALESSILLIRIREKDLPLISPHDIAIDKRKLSLATIKDILNVIAEKTILSEGIRNKIRNYEVRDDWVASALFSKLYSERKSVNFEDCLSHLYPELASEWHPTKNEALLPEHFTPGAARNVWWLSQCGHEWQDTINHRTSGRDCPLCRYKKASRTRRKKHKQGQIDLFD